jgi:8-oxo-dGTP pyrophosphatase MutT (NUDIX family)
LTRTVEAAVLAPVYRDDDGRVRLVLILRSARGVHGGQIGFPGGRREPSDADLWATALREAHEEIGLDPSSVEPLAALPVVDTQMTGYRIAPFLGRLAARPPAWRPREAEVAGILDVPIVELAAPGVHAEEAFSFPGWAAPRVVPFYRLGEHRLWGATYRIVQPLLPRLIADEWPI